MSRRMIPEPPTPPLPRVIYKSAPVSLRRFVGLMGVALTALLLLGVLGGLWVEARYGGPALVWFAVSVWVVAFALFFVLLERIRKSETP